MKPIQEVIARISSNEAVFKEIVDSQTKMSIRKYRIHKYRFMAGLVSLVAARGFMPLKGLIHAIWQ